MTIVHVPARALRPRCKRMCARQSRTTASSAREATYRRTAVRKAGERRCTPHVGRAGRLCFVSAARPRHRHAQRVVEVVGSLGHALAAAPAPAAHQPLAVAVEGVAAVVVMRLFGMQAVAEHPGSSYCPTDERRHTANRVGSVAGERRGEDLPNADMSLMNRPIGVLAAIVAILVPVSEAAAIARSVMLPGR